MSKSRHTIYLLRHGEVDGPAAIYGKTDVPVSHQGWQQLQRQAARLDSVTRIVTSPLRRCQVFANDLAVSKGLPLNIESDFRECDFGKWDGVPFDDIPEGAWGEMEAFWASPASCQFEGGEHLKDMHCRVAQAWDNLIGELRDSTTPETVLVVAHGGVIRLLLAYILHFDWWNPAIFSQWQIDYASLSKITLAQFENAKPNVQYVAMPHGWEA